jgi:proprotein convertase subtilisin/kexin type 5
MYEDSKCLKECPETFRKNRETQKCEKCNENCKRCPDSADKCEECEDGFSLLKDYTCGGCPEGQVSFKKVCIDCENPDKCLKCNPNNIRECLKCKDQLLLQPNKTCHATCDPGYYPNEYGECVKCQMENCDKCDSKECQECSDGYYLFNNTKCPKECPDGFVEVGKQCVECNDKKCVKCSENDLSVCTKCDYPNEFLKEGNV